MNRNFSILERYHFSVACIFSILMGFFDLFLSLFYHPTRFSDFSYVLLSLMTVIIASFITYEILWFVISRITGFFYKTLEPARFSVFFAAFLGLSFTLLLACNLIHFHLSLQRLIQASAIIVSSFIAALIVTFTEVHFRSRLRIFQMVRMFFCALPLLLFQALVFIWLVLYLMKYSPLSPKILVLLSGVAVISSTLLIFSLLRRRINAAKILVYFLFLTLLSPLLYVAARDIVQHFQINSFKTNRPTKQTLLVVIDTLRADALSINNPHTPLTPNLDAIAQDSVLFQKTVSLAPWTLPSMVTILTGVSPLVHTAVSPEREIPHHLKTVPEYLKDAGYYTGAIGDNPNLRRDFFSKGIVDFNFFPKYEQGDPIGLRLLTRLFPKRFKVDIATTDVTDLSVDWIKSNKNRDFFLWIHYFDPHGPYTPPVSYLGSEKPAPRIGLSFDKLGDIVNGTFIPTEEEKTWIKKLYLAEVQYVDDNIGRLRKVLKELNLYDDLLIIVTSDHGEGFWEHGQVRHGNSLYDELLRVPLMIKLPHSSRTGKVDTMVSNASIPPTILDLCGIQYDHDTLFAQSLRPFLEEKSPTFIVQPVVSDLAHSQTAKHPMRSVTYDDTKYISNYLAPQEEGPAKEFYDLARDPKEQANLANEESEKIQKANNFLSIYEKDAKHLQKKKGIVVSRENLSDEAIERLKSLGYLN